MELVLYAVIQGFSQDGNSKFTGALSYLCDVTGKSKNTVSAALNGLLEKHLIVKDVLFCHFSLQIGPTRILYDIFRFHTKNSKNLKKRDPGCPDTVYSVEGL